MKVQDNYLPEENFKQLQAYCNKTDFKIVDAGGKLFSILETPSEMFEFLKEDGHKLILTFIREAYDGFDNSARIHADNIIMGEKTALAKVLYINNTEVVTENGTAFWKHHKYGAELPEDVTNEEFDRLLLEDSNNLELWYQTDFVESKPNRLLTYNSNQFHSKWPANIAKGRRVVLVAFYAKK